MSSDSGGWNNLLESDSWDCRQGVWGGREKLYTTSYNGYFLDDPPALYLNKKYKLKADKQLLLI